MNQSHSDGLSGLPSRKLSPLAQHMVETAHLHYRSLLKPAVPLPPSPVPAQPPIQAFSKLQYRPEDVFELAVIGSQLAFFLLSSDMTACGVCGASGGSMAEPDSHHPHCKVRRWWNAVDALKIGMEVQL